MRIALANPPISDFYFTRHRMTALGSLTVKRLLEDAGHTVLYFDFPGPGAKAKTIPQPAELSYLNPFVLNETGPVAFFTSYKRLGRNFPECAEAIWETHPDLILISCFAYGYAADTIGLAEAIHRISPSVPVIVGGAGATVFPEGFLKSPAVSFVLAGEAETNITQFLSTFTKKNPAVDGVPNVYYSSDDRIIKSRVVKHSSVKDLRWICSVQALQRGGASVTTSLSRGCPKKCGFCSNYLCHGRSFRRLPIEKCIEGIAALPHSSPLYINFEDDNLLYEYSYFQSLCREINSLHGHVILSAQNGLDVSFLDLDRVPELYQFGFRHLDLSMVSTDSELLSSVHRQRVNGSIADTCRQARKAGIDTTTYVICGLKGESKATAVENLIFLHNLPTRIGISLYYSTPGIDGFADQAMWSAISPRLCCGSSAYPWHGSLTTRQLITAFRIARFSNLLKAPDALQQQHHRLAAKTISSRRLHTWIKQSGTAVLTEIRDLDNSMVADFLNACC